MRITQGSFRPVVAGIEDGVKNQPRRVTPSEVLKEISVRGIVGRSSLEREPTNASELNSRTMGVRLVGIRCELEETLQSGPPFALDLRGGGDTYKISKDSSVRVHRKVQDVQLLIYAYRLITHPPRGTLPQSYTKMGPLP